MLGRVILFTVLCADDRLPVDPRRVAVAGVSGSGKTTLAQQIAHLIGAEHIEIDALYHGPEWEPRPSFIEDVRALVATDTWTIEWQYNDARALIAERADLLVWLDLPFWCTTFPRVVRRTLCRRLRREVLWNGNVEPPLRTLFTHRENVIRWSVSTRHQYRALLLSPGAFDTGTTPIVRLRSQSEVDRWLAGPLTSAARGRAGF